MPVPPVHRIVKDIQRFVDHPTRADLTTMYLRGHTEGSKARGYALDAIAAELDYTPSLLRGDDVRVPRTSEPVRRIRFLERDVVRDVAVGLIYTCPPEVSEKAVDVEIDAYPSPPLTGPFRVRLPGTRRRPVLARPRLNPDTGERVLVCYLGRDLLTLAVGIALEPYK